VAAPGRAIEADANLDDQMPNSLLSHTNPVAEIRRWLGLTGNSSDSLAEDIPLDLDAEPDLPQLQLHGEPLEPSHDT
jgi:hypothetical protein